ncbi:MAG: nicotinamide mononucleotide transporter [Gemmatimonadaceae bacterium]|nr:nicotinamide mononucleotide transporter [Chitinophagaceae bacterium]
MQSLLDKFISGKKNNSWLEYIAVITGIASVWFSRIENILVYPVGLVNTIIYVFLSSQVHLYGEASVNLYYTIVSIYGWVLWERRDQHHDTVLKITFSGRKEVLTQLAFFAAFYVVVFSILTYLKTSFSPGAIPWADAFATATAFTGMWLMARKKVESWYWWIATNIASIPLYFSKQFVVTSVYYLILLVMAVMGLIEWRKRAIARRYSPQP